MVIELEEQLRHLSALLARRRSELLRRLIVGSVISPGPRRARLVKQSVYRVEVN